MNKRQLIKVLMRKEKIKKSEARSVVNTFFNDMAAVLSSGERVEIRGTFSFQVKQYDAFVGRNPKTGDNVKIGPKKLPHFKCSQELKQRVNRKAAINAYNAAD